MIHPTAIISNSAVLGNSVSVGPYSVIGEDVQIGDDTSVESHVIIQGPTRIGRKNRVGHFCTLGTDPQDKKYTGESQSFLEIGDENQIREYCSINRGSLHGGGHTVIGSGNWIMAYVHIAHDCIVGNHTVFANNATLAGHVIVGDYAFLGGFTGVHQFCRLGQNCFTAISSVVIKDVPPYMTVSGNPARLRGLNLEGLRRRAFGPDLISSLKKAYRTLYKNGHSLDMAVRELESQATSSAEIAVLVEFFKDSKRGIIR